MINIRLARIDDIPEIVKYIEMASGGISDFLLNGLIKGMSVQDLLEMSLNDENMPMYYKNVLVAEDKGRIVAASNFYPAEQHALPAIMRAFISNKKLKVIEPYLQSSVPGSLYIHTLAVHPDYRQTAVGLDICKKIEMIAKEQGFSCLSAHVWRQNVSVYEGLKLSGFTEVEFVDIEDDLSFSYRGGMVLLKGPDLLSS